MAKQKLLLDYIVNHYGTTNSLSAVDMPPALVKSIETSSIGCTIYLWDGS
jgi:hypothetical protein